MLGIKYLRMLNELSLQEVADKIGVTKQTASKWENGKVIPKKRLQQLSEMFNISQETLQKELTELDKVEIQKLKIINDSKKKGFELEAGFKSVTLEEMVKMLNQVAKSDVGSISIETNGVIEIPLVGYARCLENDWGVFIEEKVENDIIYKRFIIRDDNMQVEDFIFDAIEIVGDIIYNEYDNRFCFSFDINLEVVISVYDYTFKYNDMGELYEEEGDYYDDEDE